MNWGEVLAMDIDKGTAGMSRPINLFDSAVINETDIIESAMFSVLSINVHSINNKFQKIRDLTHRPVQSILCLQETWGFNPLTDYSIRGYHAPYIRTRSGEGINLGGGVGIWVQSNLDFQIINSPFLDKIIECQTIELPKQK